LIQQGLKGESPIADIGTSGVSAPCRVFSLRSFVMRKLVLAASAIALTAPMVAPAAAEAHRTGYRHSHAPTHQVYCQKRSGTTGLIIGGAAGALGGRELDRGAIAPRAPCSAARSAPCSAGMSSATC
jgi:hypothetical protein